VDLQEFFQNINRVDLLIFLFFMAFFVLGFAQGTIRRLIGIGSILFSFLFAANVAEPLGNYLGSNWTQFSKEYATMIGFLTVFLASSVAFAVVVQGLYKPQPLFQKARFLDELLGGILGLVEAALIFGCILVILDSFYRIPAIAPDAQELRFLRQFWEQLDPTNAAAMFRDTVIPYFFLLTGFLVPDWLERMYPRA
jgi:membrane protein required for colicin V production